MVTDTANRQASSLLPADLLGERERAELLAETAPGLIVAAQGAGILWASHAAARRLGLPGGAALMAQGLPSRAAGSARLAALAAGLGDTNPARLERLRFNIGFRSQVLVALCAPIRLADGTQALKVALIEAGAGTEPLDPRGLVEAISAPPAPVSGDDGPDRDPDDAARADIAAPLMTGLAHPDPAGSTPPDWLYRPAAERKPLRFVFSLNAKGDLVRLTAPLEAAVGTASAASVGQNLAAIIARFDAKAAKAIEASLGSGETWSGVRLDWPIEGSSIAVPVDLSALPVHDEDGKITGYSGFGRCHIDRVAMVLDHSPEPVPAIATEPDETPAAEPQSAPGHAANADADAPVIEDHDRAENAAAPPPEPGMDATAAAPEAWGSQADQADLLAALEAFGGPDGDMDQQPAGAAEPGEDGAAGDQAGADRDQDEIAEAGTLMPSQGATAALVHPEAPESSGAGMKQGMPIDNVVPLRGGSQPVLPAAAKSGLSMSERNAFREIARALGAKFDPDNADEPGRAPERANRAAGPAQAGEPAAPMAAIPAGAPLPGQLAAPPDAPASLLDRLPIGILVLRGDVTLFANRALTALTGYPDLATFITEDGQRAIFRKGALPRATDGFDTIVLATREGEMIPVDAHLQIADWEGEPATVISLRRAIELEQGKALRSVALDLKRERLEAAELRAILDTATDGVITLDQDGRVLSLNGAAEAVFGLDQNEVVGQSFTTLLRNESHSEALAYFSGLKNAGVKSVLNDGREVFGREKKGGRIPLFMTLGQISEGEPRRYCAVLHDLTAWKRAEAELTEARRAAEMASAKKSDFLTKISHEIRTPMNAIIGFAELMLEERLGPIGTPRYKDYLGDIRTSGQHVVSLVNDLLDLAKIEAGRMELNFAATDLNAIVASSVGIIQPQANSSRVLVRTQLAGNLPAVVADERSIRQIVLNMLSNATRFTEAGGQVIVATALLETGEAVIRIRDTGVGMTASDIEQALEPFRQVGARRDHGGTGLGLPLTKALVEANRASFSIRSTPGEGTMIEITFPSTRVLAE
jgi:PAS domain S-box-containing protein